MMGLLKATGIEKGLPYAPDAKRKKILDAAGAEAHKYLLDQYVNGAIPPFYADRKWSGAVPPSAIPTGMNWVPTTSNNNYWLYFRFYGPEPAVFTKSWQLPDLVEVK
jgi:hypothetical protein